MGGALKFWLIFWIEEGRTSFLKKRSKKLLFTAGRGNAVAKSRRNQSFFASFCSQKEVLPC
jgi:hypothetical protein